MSSPQVTRQRIRLRVETSSTGTIQDDLTSEQPDFWRGNALQFECGFFWQDALCDISVYSSITLEIKDASYRSKPALMSKTVAAAALDNAVTQDSWDDGTAQHALFEFDEDETALDLISKTEKDFWCVISAVVAATGQHVTLGATTISVIEDGTPSDSDISPVQGANLIPDGAAYDPAGSYTLAVTAGKAYRYSKGANDTSLTNGSQTLNADTVFIASGATVTLTGTISALVTARIYYPVYFTADESDARYGTNNLKIVNPAGTSATFVSSNGQYKMTIGIDDNGVPFQQVQPNTPA